MNEVPGTKANEKEVTYDELGLWGSERSSYPENFRNNNTSGRNTGENDQYYVQQTVRGKPGQPPPPVDAARQPPVRPRQELVESFDEEIFRNSFSTRKIRHRFIRKVYCILSVSLAVTTAVIGVFVFEDNVNEFARRNMSIGMGFLYDSRVKDARLFANHTHFRVASLAFYIALACVESLRRKVPLNLILLGIYTILSAVGFGFLAANYSADIVLFSAGITAGVCLLITLIACQNWVDVTGCAAYLCVAGIVVFIFGIIAMIVHLTTGYGKILMIIYSAVASLLISMYFMFTTQLIIGGKKYEMSPEEYILGAIMLYIEIMTLFILIMQLFGFARGG